MTLEDLAKTSFGNLGRHKARTALSIVGVMVGILTIVTMLSLGVGVQQEILRVFKNAGLETVRARPVTEERTAFNQFAEPRRTVLITPALVEEMRARDDVVKVNAHIYTPRGANASLRIGENTVRVYVGGTPWLPSEPFTMPPELVAGEELTDGAQGEIVVNASALDALGYGQSEFGDLIGQEITLALQAPRGDVQDFSLRLVGIIDAYDDFEKENPRAYLGLADALSLKAWWYNDPDILEHQQFSFWRSRGFSRVYFDAIVTPSSVMGYFSSGRRHFPPRIARIFTNDERRIGISSCNSWQISLRLVISTRPGDCPTLKIRLKPPLRTHLTPY